MTGVLALILLLVGVVAVFKAVRMVPQGYEWTVCLLYTSRCV